MNIAIFFDQKLYGGGGFQQSLALSLLLKNNNSKQYNFIFVTTLKSNISILNDYGIDAKYYPISWFKKFEIILRKNKKLQLLIFPIFKFMKRSTLELLCDKYAIDLVYFLSPSLAAFLLDRYNYIYTVWDLCHRDHVEFPEVRVSSAFENRELILQRLLPKAFKIIVDSDLGKKNITRRYAIDEERLVVLPFLIKEHSNFVKHSNDKAVPYIKKKYSIKGQYLFYPAQFWAHKNHRYILDALKILKEKHSLELFAVFSGSDQGNLDFILNMAEKMELKEQIRYIGFVSGKEIQALYQNALALVMPTYFGPTNIPPLEAFYNNCSVIYSDLDGLRQQCEGAALFVDLKNPNSLVQKLLLIINKDPIIEVLKKEGKKKLKEWSSEHAWSRLKSTFAELEFKTKTWK